MKKLNKKGFTLTEMIVVIAIIGILAAVLIPSVVIYVQRAQRSNDEQLAASMTDEIERYCILNDVDQNILTASDVRSILVAKEFDLVPSRKVYSYVYNVTDKNVQIIDLKNIDNSINPATADEPAEYAEGMFLIGKGKSDFEQCINDFYLGNLDNIHNYDLTDKQNELKNEFCNATLFVQNNSVSVPVPYQAANNTDDTIKHVIFCELTFNVPNELAKYADKITSFNVPQLVCTIDDEAKVELKDKIGNFSSIKSGISCEVLDSNNFKVVDEKCEFELGSLVEGTVVQAFDTKYLGYTSVKSKDHLGNTSYTLYYVVEATVRYYKMEGLAAEGNAIFLAKVADETSYEALISLGRLHKTDLLKLDILNSDLYIGNEIEFYIPTNNNQ